MRWSKRRTPVHWHPPRAALAGAVVFWAVFLTVCTAAGAEGQVSAEVTLEDERGMALVRNTRDVKVAVQVRVWESNEEGREVQLTRRAQVAAWPSEFTLKPGERQVVRLLMKEGAYVEGTLLRLETVLTPTQPDAMVEATGGPDGPSAELTYAFCILSKLHVGR